MFICYLHGWTGAENPCPLCHSVHMFTSSGTDAEIKWDTSDWVKLSAYPSEEERLRAEIERLKAGLDSCGIEIDKYMRERNEAKVAAEKLAEALEHYAALNIKNYIAHDALTKYREKFSKE